ncbi:hypothetical protein GCM10022393_13400 [Aquimarina addita]|uniref:Uncharacterized protein n=2 Tax=Aquimarina addita TaxID=870485 RepID=A0ABP7XEX6_9FLAO
MNSDEVLEWVNFPAISEDGTYFLAVYSEYSCCLDLGGVLQKIKASNGKVVEEIILSSSEEIDPPFTLEKKQEILKDANRLLKEFTYHALQKLPSLEENTKLKDDRLQIQVDLANRSYVSKKFSLPKLKASGYCCGAIDDKKNCLVDQSITSTWLSKIHETFFIESGFSGQADGCDQGPFFKIVPAID